ncbi:MAG TPA: MFS transporter [Thermoanaerobaculia bacterium]|nr:MFS transporter [Thermoanaerobaculia bacterium]
MAGPAPRPALLTIRFLRLWSFGFFTFFTLFQLLPTIPFRIVDLGGTRAQAGLFLAIYTYACALSAPITGAIADHVGRRRLLRIASTGFVFFSLLYGVVESLGLLLAIAVVHGVAWSGILSSSAAIMTEIIPESRRTEGIAYWGMASTAAVAIAPLVGLTLYRRSWQTLTLELTATSILMVVLALFVRAGQGRSDRPFPALKEVVDWRVMVLSLSLFAIAFSYGGITSYVAMMSVDRGIQPPSLFFSVFAAAILLTRLITGPLGDRIGPKRLLYPSVAMIPPALALLAFADSRADVVVAGIVFGTGFGGAYPAFATYVLGRTDPGRRAATFGSIVWAFDTGIGTGSLGTGWLIEHSGYRTAFLAGAAVAIASIPIFVRASRLLPAAAVVTGPEP